MILPACRFSWNSEKSMRTPPPIKFLLLSLIWMKAQAMKRAETASNARPFQLNWGSGFLRLLRGGGGSSSNMFRVCYRGEDTPHGGGGNGKASEFPAVIEPGIASAHQMFVSKTPLGASDAAFPCRRFPQKKLPTTHAHSTTVREMRHVVVCASASMSVPGHSRMAPRKAS